MNFRCLALALLALYFLPSAAQAQPPQSHQRGLNAQTIYQQTGLDHVNLFNGNLAVRLPIGSPYPVSSGLSYGLVLTYNASSWDYDERSCLWNGSILRYSVPQPETSINAGFGWSLQLGRMKESSTVESPPWTYTSPDGSRHSFTPQLHPGHPSTLQPNTWFSRNGSYLRLRRLSPAGSSCAAQPPGSTTECLLLEFPDGTIHEFRNFPSSGTSDWRVSRMRDRYNHHVDIDYGTANQWKLKDQWGRTQTIHFEGDRVSTVDLTAFGGTTSSYRFEYVSREIDRQDYFAPPCSTSADETNRMTVDLLSRLVLPDQSYYEMAYYTSDTPDNLSGGLQRLRLPTGGELRWTYQAIDMLTFEPAQQPDYDWSQVAYGVASKEIYEQADDTEPIGTWTYDHKTLGNPSLAPDEIIPCFHTVTVTDPLGHQTVNYFSSATNYRRDYSLPFTRCDPHNNGAEYPPSGLLLSQEVYDGSVVSGQKKRSIWVRYESSGIDWNHRVQARKVVYHDDDNRFRQEEHSDFDGLGHYRKTVAGLSPSETVTDTRSWTYNAMGWRVTESVWGDANKKTIFEHDRFGRLTAVRPPGLVPPLILDHEGDRVTTREVQLGIGAGGSTRPVYATQVRDTFGRLIQVCEGQTSAWNGSCTGGETLDTRYEYDVLGQLRKVCTGLLAGVCGQERYFTMDFRGLVKSERHPEIGNSGNGWTDFTYDALGNPTSRKFRGSHVFGLQFRYDRASRLVGIDEFTSATGTRKFKEFFFARANNSTNKKAGKLVLAKRYNWVDILPPLRATTGNLPAVISEAFEYRGLGGAVSARQTRYQALSTHYLFVSGFSYDEQGNLAQLEYPRCLHGECAGEDPSRSVDFEYERGFLRKVDGFANFIAYQSGGMVRRVPHTAVSDWIDINASDKLSRPRKIRTEGAVGGDWDSGSFSYDGQGNINSLGALRFRYDVHSRLVEGAVDAGTAKQQLIDYDRFGNIQKLTNDGDVQYATTSQTTNRLDIAGSDYDLAGNLTDITLAGITYKYDYDPSGLIKHLRSNDDQSRIHVYNAFDERVLTFDCAANICENGQAQEHWTIRGPGGQVLREYRHVWGQRWNWQRDTIYRDGALLAAIEPAGTFHFHLDHLGTPRLITNAAGYRVAYHAYYPFGLEATDPAQSGFTKKFTGHERDDNGPGLKGQLDYMMGRYCSPVMGRFLSPDPVGGNPLTPQSWNRYAYVLGNPLRFTDPYGLEPAGTFGETITVTDSYFIIPKWIFRNIFFDARPHFNKSRFDFSNRDFSAWSAWNTSGGCSSSFICQVSGEVGENATALSYMEFGLSAFSMSGVTSSVLFGGGVAAATPRFSSLATRETTVDLFRAVSPAEFYDIAEFGFRMAPGGQSLAGKQFALRLEEALKFSDHTPDVSAIIRVRIPKSTFDELDFSRNIDPFIFRHGVTTVQPGKQLRLFNQTLKEVEQVF